MSNDAEYDKETAVNRPAAPVQPAAPQPAPGAPPPPQPVAEKQGTIGFGVTALVLGIVALLFCWFPFVGGGIGILAVIFGIIGCFNPGKGMAIGGLVTGAAGLLINIAIIAWAAFKVADTVDKIGKTGINVQ